MASYCCIMEFCPETNSIRLYLDQVQAYFRANKIAEDQKAMILLSSIGSGTFAKLSDLTARTSPLEIPFDDIVRTLKSHFEPKRVEIAERYKFYQRNQASGEAIAAFDASQNLATYCNFGDALPTYLRDRFVCGLRKESLRQQLLAIDDLIYVKAQDLAKDSEAAERHSKSMQKAVEPVHAVPAVPQNQHRRVMGANFRAAANECYRCGGRHKAMDLFVIFVKKQGHIPRVCRMKKKGNRERKADFKETHCIEGGNSSDSDSNAETGKLNSVGDGRRAPITLDLSIDGAPVKMELDTGAARSIISEENLKKLWKTRSKLKPTTVRLQTYSGQSLKVLGKLRVQVEYKREKATCTLLVVEGTGPSLFGRDWLAKIRLQWEEIRINFTHSPQDLETILARNKEVFRPTLGVTKNIVASLKINPEARPVFCNVRPVPYALREKVQQELRRLENDSIIQRYNFHNGQRLSCPC